MSCVAIEPNPDISGVGVRTAMYAQAVLTLIQPILASLDGHVSEDELVGLHQLYLGILLPGCALLFSAIIQARTFGLSVYHAIIVLNLSWINNTSALVFFQFALIVQIKLDKERGFRENVGAMLELLYKSLETPETSLESDRQIILDVAKGHAARMKSVLRSGLTNRKEFEGSKEILEDVIQNLSAFLGAAHDTEELTEIIKATNRRLRTPRFRKSLGMPDTSPRKWKRAIIDNFKRIPGGRRVVDLLERDWIMTALASAHLILFAGFGVWLWFTIHHFGDCESLTNRTTYSIFVPVPVISQPLRVASIVVYVVCLLPVINIAILWNLELFFIFICQQPIARIRTLIRKNNGSSASTSPEPTSLLASPGPSVLYLIVVLTFLVQAYFIITTELTILNNRHLLIENSGSHESDWTFGQTLAVALILIPLAQVWGEVGRNVEFFKKQYRSLKKQVQLALWKG